MSTGSSQIIVPDPATVKASLEPDYNPNSILRVSDDEPRFIKVGTRFVGERLARAEVVPLG